MKVFLSWSGEQSRAIAEILHGWLPKVIQRVKPYYTPDDITKGSLWNSEIAAVLEESRVGIICLTRDNLREPWIMFEAGALSKIIKSSRVCPILFNVKNADIVGPLASFQAAHFDKKEIRRVLNMINEELKTEALSQEQLNDEFKMWWPSLEEQILAELRTEVKEPAPLRTEQEVLGEILELGRVAGRLEKEFKGRLFSSLGYIMGEMSMKPGSIEPTDKDRLIEAVSHCLLGYEYLKEVGGAPEYMALNNWVYYSTALNDSSRAGFLLPQARRLLEAGEQHNAANLILTGCRTILQFSPNPKEKRHARRRITALLQGPLSDKQRKEVQLYLKYFREATESKVKLRTKAGTHRPGKSSTRTVVPNRISHKRDNNPPSNE